jgi:Ala-tRNA(Pro) deacylase
MPILTRLKEFLDGNNVKYVSMTHAPAYTAQEIAAAQHVPGEEFAKVVIARAGGRFVMAVLEAPQRLDLDKLARQLPEKQAALASENEFKGLFPQCEPGAMPPFGNLFGLEVFVDRDLERDEEIVFQAGTHRDTVRMAYADFVRLVRPTVAPLAAG